MFQKITKKNYLTSLFITGFCLLANSSFAQTTVVDFEVPSEYQHLAWEGTAEVVANPNSSGINTSSNVAKYTTPANKAWGHASVVIINTPLAFKDLDHLVFSAIVPSSTQMYVKLENTSSNTGVAEAWATPTANVNWQAITLNFSALGGIDVNTATYDKFTFFFNVNDNVGGEFWHFDDLVVHNTILSNQKNTTEEIAIYPNPVKDFLSINGLQTIFEEINVNIYDTTGKLVKSANTAQINLIDLQKGMYVAKITGTNDLNITRKFIKN